MITFMWFIANNSQEDILDLGLRGLVDKWEAMQDLVEQRYIDRLDA